MKRVLLTGMSGVGKSAVLERLSAEGVLCMELEEGYMLTIAGEPLIDLDKVKKLFRTYPTRAMVLAGCAMNQRALGADAILLLTASPATMKKRIAQRQNPFGKAEAAWQKILSDKETFEPLLMAACDDVISTEQPLEETVRQVKKWLEEPNN